ncbi:hypothetical protein SAMN04488570_3629 [Nocardioides scoriae]|uniref:Lipoprotein n=1 Tax=Nocardioides scoriae TaxID=642780 RepID=A0A1H1XXQ8_9ACTN|nr:hypothetical protein [Nocardioides scoriae]SDT13689.1 hypothetical protein SAMN04488570_3629 [Nocardioides scoriae]
MRTPLLACLGLALTSALTVTAAGPVQARSTTSTDPTGDVRTFVLDETAEDGPIADSPSDTSEGDVVSSTLSHTRRSVRVRISYAELTSTPDSHGWYFEFRGSNGQKRVVEVATQGGQTKGYARMYRKGNGRQVCKRAIGRTVSYRDDDVLVTFPRRCMETPAQVRMSNVGYWIEDSGSDTVTFYYDDPLREGGSADDSATTFTPWVKRG